MPADKDRMFVTYTIEAEGADPVQFALDIALPEVALARPDGAALPDWTKLDYHKCAHCPLSSKDSPRCPVAVQLVDYGQRAGRMVSFSRVMVTIAIDDRVLAAETSAQEALRSA